MAFVEPFVEVSILLGSWPSATTGISKAENPKKMAETFRAEINALRAAR